MTDEQERLDEIALDNGKEYISECCGAEAIEDYKTSFRDHHEAIPIYRCKKCGNECEVDEGDSHYDLEGQHE